ncbi:ArsR/SmtB family transcription factor [Herbiconiux sp. P18]|uniref:ArsR/SmtB family transcription factor n=1 Tax=Herbiconiux liangxiaofengii TaxID=3342795 RepID=UPI0035B8F35C
MTELDRLRATAHPLRLQMLSLVTASALSAAEVGRELRVSQAAASYHLRVLERAGLVRVVEVVRLRGGEAKRYRHESSAEPFRLDDSVPAPSSSAAGRPADQDSAPEERALYVAALAAELQRRSAARVEGPQVTTDAELWVDADTWRRVVLMVGQASALLHARAQPPRSPGTGPVSMTAALFPLKRPRP